MQIRIAAMLLVCACLFTACAKKATQTQAQAPVAQTAPCASNDFHVFPSFQDEEETYRVHGQKLKSGQLTGDEIHLDAQFLGEDENAKLVLGAVEFLYAEKDEGGSPAYFHAKFVRGLAGGFSALLLDVPGIRGEQLVSDQSTEEYLKAIFADGDKVFSEIDLQVKTPMTTDQMAAMEAKIKDLVARVFCQKQGLSSWQGGVYFRKLEKPRAPDVPQGAEGAERVVLNFSGGYHERM